MRKQFLEGFGHERHASITRASIAGELVYDAIHESVQNAWEALATKVCEWDWRGSPVDCVENFFRGQPEGSSFEIDHVPLLP